MYRRYDPKPRPIPDINKPPPSSESKRTASGQGNMNMNQARNRYNPQMKKKVNIGVDENVSKSEHRKKAIHPLMKFIPQSLYNSETGKVFGIMTADDLLIVALILVMLDSGDDCEDNTMLVYALIYILLSEYIELPF